MTTIDTAFPCRGCGTTIPHYIAHGSCDAVIKGGFCCHICRDRWYVRQAAIRRGGQLELFGGMRRPVDPGGDDA